METFLRNHHRAKRAITEILSKTFLELSVHFATQTPTVDDAVERGRTGHTI